MIIHIKKIWKLVSRKSDGGRKKECSNFEAATKTATQKIFGYKDFIFIPISKKDLKKILSVCNVYSIACPWISVFLVHDGWRTK